jgi:hypothetical protein
MRATIKELPLSCEVYAKMLLLSKPWRYSSPSEILHELSTARPIRNFVPTPLPEHKELKK